MTTRLTRLACAGAVALLSAAPAYAQGTGRPDRPYRGLFGGGVGETEQSLTAAGGISTSFDSNPAAGGLAGPASDLGAGLFDGRGYASLNGSIAYSLDRTRVGFNASARSGMQYVPKAASAYIPGYGLAFGGRAQITRNFALTGNHSISVQPYNALVPMAPLAEAKPGDALLLDPAFGVRREERIVQSSSVGFSRQLGRRNSLGLNYSRSQDGRSFFDSDLTTQGASARFTTSIARGLGLYIGYVISEAQYVKGGEPVRTQNFDGGLDFSRSRGVEITRRTRLSFGGGVTGVTSGSPDAPLRKTYHVTGNAILTREIARSWSSSVSYNRSVGFVTRFRDPFLNDSVSAGISGLINRRLNFSTSTGVVLSQVGLSSDNRYHSYFASAGLSTAFTRYLSVGVDASYYRYRFDGTASLPTGFQSELGRRSIRVYLSTWASLYQRGKGPDASR